MRRALLIGWLWLALLVASRAETLPPKPEAYFNDYAGVVSKGAARALDEELRQFERDTSNQIVVAVFPKLDTASSLEDYAQRVFESWKVGQAKQNNGAVLFVFVQDHKLRIQTGYGLEGALPDITCNQIIQNEIVPAFKKGNYEAGLNAGIEAMMQATRGEYKGTGSVHGDNTFFDKNGSSVVLIIFVSFFVLIFIMQIRSSWQYGTMYSRNGRSFTAGFLLNLLSSIASSSGGSSRGGSSSGGGGFSGGGGSSGGGGASGSW